jgi:hypothetical protein
MMFPNGLNMKLLTVVAEGSEPPEKIRTLLQAEIQTLSGALDRLFERAGVWHPLSGMF